MCGIAGIVDFAGRPVPTDGLERACDTMCHRGPDDRGTWTHSRNGLSVGLAATRLAIIDPTPGGRQPMISPDSTRAIVFNGVIYNYRQLRDQLLAAGETFTTRSDTEVALAACARWGTAALDRFNGMWALAYFDVQRQNGFLARDRFGIKPLVWARHGQQLLFASEMRTLHCLGDWPRDVDDDALIHYLRFGFVAHPQTIYHAVHRLEPGTYMEYNSSSVASPTRYYRLPAPETVAPVADYAGACRRTRRALLQSVAARRVADVPIGAFLSGGLDSSIVVAHLAELSASPIKTFSVGWADQAAYDETAYARCVAERFQTDHYELKCRFQEVIDLLPSLLHHLGEPFFDSSMLPTAIVSEFARAHVTVILSGDGGDELFGGYWRYLAHGVHDRYHRLPQWMRAGLIEPLMRIAATSKSSTVGNRVRQFRKLIRAGSAHPFRRHIAWSQILAPEARDLLFNVHFDCDADDPVLRRIEQETEAFDRNDPLNRILAFDLQYSLPCDMLHKVDLAAMFHSLEVRVPFLDPEVVACALQLPSSVKIDRGQGKAILKDAYRDVLPDDVLTRTKVGFEVPIGEFFRNELRDMFLDTVTPEVLDSFGLIDSSAVQRIYDDHCARRSEHADLLFALLSLCWWRRAQGASCPGVVTQSQ